MKKVWLFIFLVMCASRGSAAPLPLDWIQDGLLIGGVTVLNLGSLYIQSRQIPLTDLELAALDPLQIPGIDRWVTGMWSGTADKISTVTEILSVALPAVTLPLMGGSQDIIALMVYFSEAELLASGLTGIVKGLAGRPRPYVYNTSLSPDIRCTAGSQRSFFSGHSSTAFCGAAFFAMMLDYYLPGTGKIDQALKYSLTITGYTLATATGILRVVAGQHFVTDVLVGAGVGILCGWLVPAVHRLGDNKPVQISLFQDENSGVYFQYGF